MWNVLHTLDVPGASGQQGCALPLTVGLLPSPLILSRWTFGGGPIQGAHAVTVPVLVTLARITLVGLVLRDVTISLCPEK